MPRLAVRTTGKKVKVYLTNAGSVAAGKRLAQTPEARAAQSCIKNAPKGEGRRTAIRQCMARIR